MRLAHLAILAIAAMTIPAEAQPAAIPTVLTVTAEARVDQVPDLAEITAGVVTTAATASEASRQNAQQMARVIAAVRGARVAEADIQTVGLSLQPQYDYQDRKAPQLTGYQAQNTVSVKLRDLQRSGAVIDALVTAGSNQIGGPTFRIANEEPVLDKARTQAVAKARARAELYARAAGMRVKRIARIVEGGAEPPRPMPTMRMSMAADSAPTPVQPGQVGLSAQVTIDFDLE